MNEKMKELQKEIKSVDSKIEDFKGRIHFFENIVKKDLIEKLQAECNHSEEIVVKETRDYDDMEYTVTCKFCGKVLLNYVSRSEYYDFIKKYNGKIYDTYDKEIKNDK